LLEGLSAAVLSLVKKLLVNASLLSVLSISQKDVLLLEHPSLNELVEPELMVGLVQRLFVSFWVNKLAPMDSALMYLNNNHTHANVTLDTNSVKMERNVLTSTNAWLQPVDTVTFVERKEPVLTLKGHTLVAATKVSKIKAHSHPVLILMNVLNLVYASMDPASTQRAASSVLVMRVSELTPLNRAAKMLMNAVNLKQCAEMGVAST